jgi:hypothetical protein
MNSRVPLLGKKWQLEVQKVGNIPITGVVVGRGRGIKKTGTTMSQYTAQQFHSVCLELN